MDPEQLAAQPDADDADAQVSEASPPGDEVQYVDLVVDELALARAQIDAGLAGVAEGTVRRRIAWLEADGSGMTDETDALRALLAEALWRQGRLAAARSAFEGIRASSPQRRLPASLVVEADALAAAGERDRAAGAMERVVAAVGADAAWELRAGRDSQVAWPLPDELNPEPPRPARAPWGPPPPQEAAEEPGQPDDERIAAARARMEEARVAYVAGELERGDAEMSIAVRLDGALAGDGVAILEPTLGAQPSADRLLLYGDLLRAAGRQAEADEAYDRAVGRRG